MQILQIDMGEMVRKIFGVEPEYIATEEITKEISLHRFNNDQCHILIDGGGGYIAFAYPATTKQEQVASGHLSDFVAPIEGTTIH